MANTTNYNWETPDDTDLVKDGAAAIRTLGSSVDTTTKALNPSTTLGDIEYRSATANTNTRLPIGTTGQILSVVGGVPSWVANDVGDITAVSAGTGISGGGTSGDITITNSMATAIDAKGDLIVGTGADTFSRLAAGTNTYILTADSAEATGLKWAAPASGGKVLQVVQGTKLDTASTTSQSFVASGVSVSITPSSASSKILIISQVSLGVNPSASQPYLSLYRGASAIFQGNTASNRPRITSGMALTNGNFLLTLPITYLDSPATTSATTYEIYYRSSEGGSAYINRSDGDNDATTYSPRGASSIIALEIGA